MSSSGNSAVGAAGSSSGGGSSASASGSASATRAPGPLNLTSQFLGPSWARGGGAAGAFSPGGLGSGSQAATAPASATSSATIALGGSSVTLAQGVGGFGGLTGLLGPGSSRPAKRSTRPPQRRSGPSSDDTNASSAASRAWNSSSSFNNSASDGAGIGSSALAPGAAVHGNATTSDGGDLKHLFSAAAAAGLGTDGAQQTAMGGAFDRPRRKVTRYSREELLAMHAPTALPSSLPVIDGVTTADSLAPALRTPFDPTVIFRDWAAALEKGSGAGGKASRRGGDAPVGAAAGGERTGDPRADAAVLGGSWEGRGGGDSRGFASRQGDAAGSSSSARGPPGRGGRQDYHRSSSWRSGDNSGPHYFGERDHGTGRGGNSNYRGGGGGGGGGGRYGGSSSHMSDRDMETFGSPTDDDGGDGGGGGGDAAMWDMLTSQTSEFAARKEREQGERARRERDAEAAAAARGGTRAQGGTGQTSSAALAAAVGIAPANISTAPQDAVASSRPDSSSRGVLADAVAGGSAPGSSAMRTPERPGAAAVPGRSQGLMIGVAGAGGAAALAGPAQILVSPLPVGVAPPQQQPGGWGGVPPAPTLPAPVVDPSTLRWLYRDPKGVVQGPFGASEMREWFEAAYFPKTLPMACDPRGPFVPLAQAFAHDMENAFRVLPTFLLERGIRAPGATGAAAGGRPGMPGLRSPGAMGRGAPQVPPSPIVTPQQAAASVNEAQVQAEVRRRLLQITGGMAMNQQQMYQLSLQLEVQARQDLAMMHQRQQQQQQQQQASNALRASREQQLLQQQQQQQQQQRENAERAAHAAAMAEAAERQRQAEAEAAAAAAAAAAAEKRQRDLQAQAEAAAAQHARTVAAEAARAKAAADAAKQRQQEQVAAAAAASKKQQQQQQAQRGSGGGSGGQKNIAAIARSAPAPDAWGARSKPAAAPSLEQVAREEAEAEARAKVAAKARAKAEAAKAEASRRKPAWGAANSGTASATGGSPSGVGAAPRGNSGKSFGRGAAAPAKQGGRPKRSAAAPAPAPAHAPVSAPAPASAPAPSAWGGSRGSAAAASKPVASNSHKTMEQIMAEEAEASAREAAARQAAVAAGKVPRVTGAWAARAGNAARPAAPVSMAAVAEQQARERAQRLAAQQAQRQARAAGAAPTAAPAGRGFLAAAARGTGAAKPAQGAWGRGTPIRTGPPAANIHAAPAASARPRSTAPAASAAAAAGGAGGTLWQYGGSRAAGAGGSSSAARRPAAAATRAGATKAGTGKAASGGRAAGAGSSRAAASGASAPAPAAASGTSAFGNQLDPSLARWCSSEMQRLTGNSDIDLLQFCATLDSPATVRAYLRDYLGSTPQVSQFATEFIARRKGTRSSTAQRSSSGAEADKEHTAGRKKRGGRRR